ncbi:SDR family oxidoreductase [Duganella sp. FT134W]|uniref:SDR family oxidoreductase n=1 Tax=Duganella margarita TaxID=2692170 RepID=A0A7X4KJM5_9BURK|nr:SDR family oxidoreductase [Duganella margarita]MYM75730.1 SDR family oxidoreductase [Duganella margarita]
MSGRLSGQRVIVLGASSGLGLAVAREAVREDAEVMIVSSQIARIEKALAMLGPKAQGCALDLGDESAIERFFNICGAFDHMVYTAGDALQLAPLAGTNLQTARSAFEIRYWGAMAAAKYGARNLRPGGSLTLTTGIAAQKPHANWTLVASVCGAVEALTRALAVELAPIRVNAVSPGVVATNLWSGMTEDACQSMYADLAAKLPVGRVGSAEDVAAAYLFLMTSGFATGQVHTVDGGGVLM